MSRQRWSVEPNGCRSSIPSASDCAGQPEPRCIRVLFSERVDGEQREAFVAQLAALGLCINGADGLNCSGPKLVVFTGAADAALELVRAESCHGQERVLATAIDRSSLASHDALALIRAGAVDAFGWVQEGAAAKMVARIGRFRAIDALIASDAVAQRMVGGSPSWLNVLRQVTEVAAFSDAPVLVTGETGTGKELIARLIHELDPRENRRDFVVADCTTVVPELSGSEFFGHEKGAFTGAISARNGAFALADGGTLFLDEIGELPPQLQAELLRVAQEHTYKRVGGSQWQHTSFRLICATHRDLHSEQSGGRFRSDLFYRISGWTIHLPPLRERPEDIIPLIRFFLSQQLSYTPDIDDAVCEYLVRGQYPGNIRELKQIAARMAHRHVGVGPITIGDLGQSLGETHSDAWYDGVFCTAIRRAIAMGVGLKEIGRMAEDIAVRLAVQCENGSLQGAARRLGVTDRALQMRRASARPAELSSDKSA